MNLKAILSHPTARRLINGFGAGLLGKVWILIVQIVLVPALTYSWGGAGYGVWLMVTAIPTFIALSDFGLGQAVAVRMTQAVARGQHNEALKAFQSAWLFLTAMTATICVAVATGAIIWQLGHPDTATASSPFTPREISIAIALSACYAFLSLQLSIQRGIFQATHKFAVSALIVDTLFLVNGLTVASIALLGGGIIGAALGQLSCQVLGLVVATSLARKFEPWARQGIKHADMATLKSLLKPSLGALSLTLSNSLGLQGVVLTIGWFLGPAAAAAFSTSRMLTRIPLQFSGLLTRASIPELIHVKMSGNTRLWRRLLRLNIALSLAIMAPVAIGLTVFGPQILQQMSHGKLSSSHLTFALLGLAASFCSAWMALGSQLLSENRQSSFGHIALTVYLASAATPFFFRGDITPTLCALVVADLVILLRVFQQIRQSMPEAKPSDVTSEAKAEA
ncbi:lipopolysaccharide biosynthesis protein [Kaistia geumhonensis]|uniref:O-antigen/teichoic acid export membrane protein n=1 Tax=Kaistia geumhonensis TaxID=410839 RepID=A0ABU0M1F4_9HYPH|nr:lipopolysaccharide biosynthesis protein [Kaistia geumhonensis]MCX5480092.1 lipopolysaccharide biosynthesis protein [Kaistia geumhonensis]MDQ0514680.1 O-antigen/teichoic acid export membrane protein [Kaistia geumhonensis]